MCIRDRSRRGIGESSNLAQLALTYYWTTPAPELYDSFVILSVDVYKRQPLEPSPYIYPGEYFDYSFTICNPPGTYMYHSHVEVPIQDNAGLFGGLIVENPCRTFDAPDKDYLCILCLLYTSRCV